MTRVLVAYATTHGHTRRIAGHVAATLRREGLVTDVRELRQDGGDPLPSDYDAVVVAASLHAGRHQRAVVEWARHHHTLLARRPSALLSVSLTAADDSAEARAAAHSCMDELADDTGWTPDVAAAVAGALQYREYDLPTRVLMRLIARRHQQPTDVSHDVVYTDWDELDRFAADFAAHI